jgi:hypothetical protein
MARSRVMDSGSRQADFPYIGTGSFAPGDGMVTLILGMPGCCSQYLWENANKWCMPTPMNSWHPKHKYTIRITMKKTCKP